MHQCFYGIEEGVPPQILELVKYDQNYSRTAVTPYAYYKTRKPFWHPGII
jgi:hypothetical protein